MPGAAAPRAAGFVELRPVILLNDVPVATPNTGVTNVGLVANTKAPEPVSSDITPASCDEVVDSKAPKLFEVKAMVPEEFGTVRVLVVEAVMFESWNCNFLVLSRSSWKVVVESVKVLLVRVWVPEVVATVESIDTVAVPEVVATEIPVPDVTDVVLYVKEFQVLDPLPILNFPVSVSNPISPEFKTVLAEAH
jgi:hypothetical protein